MSKDINGESTLDSVFYAPKDLVIKKSKEAYLLLDPNMPNWLVVNEVGKDILAMCDGTKTMEEIIKVLCQKYDESYDKSVENVLDFIKKSKKDQFLKRDPHPPLKRLNKEDMNLIDLWINVTNKCNLRCIHCHLSSGVPLKDEMTTIEIFEVIDEAIGMQLKQLTISGGEPFIRDDILAILEYAHEQPIERLVIITNGTLITEEMAEKLKSCEVDVQVSLEGAKKETHEFIRGRGTYDKTIRGIKTLVHAGVYTRIGMTITKNNMDEMEEMAEFAKNMGLRDLHFIILQEKGRAENNERLKLRNRDYIAIVKRINEISKSTPISISTEEAFCGKVEKLYKIDLCGAGSSLMSVAANGNVYPCAGLHGEEFCAGNIREQNLKDIWKTSEVFKKLRSLSVLDIEKCFSCDLRFICGGGCHVDAIHAYGRLDMPSPRCEANKKIFWGFLIEKLEEAIKGL